MRTIPLGGAIAAGRVALIDDEDWELVSRYRWRAENRRARTTTYARCNYVAPDGRQVIMSMHKLLTGWPQTDHINHDGLDNRRANLRPATDSQNHANQRPGIHTSRFKGVSWESRPAKWRAIVKVNGTQRFLGYFICEEDAARAYDAAALHAFGEYAFVNFR